ncbi:hypothetical protein [Paraburkholderia sp. J76]|uniref:hypothetical protein n=1 Tax=Paraburkholderia sp. J76 TaxID=2805439 RepID=UPI002ABE9452|nr:hypothetical protein [Paraburkholderia sp. J76]
MALDFSNLPPEKPDPEPPSRFVWTVVFFVLTLIGVFAAFLLWPAGEPTNTPWFWTAITVFPVGFGAFVVNRRYSVYEGRRLDVKEWNKASKEYIEREFDRESIPVLVLGSSIHVTGVDGAADFAKIADGSLTLGAQTSVHEESESVSARWLDLLEARLAANDAERHAIVLEWLFDQILTDLATPLAALPVELGLRVRLELSGYIGEIDALRLWKDRWQAHKRSAVQLSLAEGTSELMAVDTWLDEQNGLLSTHAVLLVSIALSTMLDANPPHGSTEAGVALLLASAAIAERHKLNPAAAIHRPVRSDQADLDHALTTSLRWGNAGVRQVGSAWMTGFDGESVGPLHASLIHIGEKAPREDALPEFDLDRSAGNAGPSAAWLAVACAAQAAATTARPQLVAQRLADHTVLSVVAASDETSIRKHLPHEPEIQT